LGASDPPLRFLSRLQELRPVAIRVNPIRRSEGGINAWCLLIH
jgi:hypothetical protein